MECRWSPETTTGTFTGWSQEEDTILYRQLALLGNRWDEIASFLPGRSGFAVASHYRLLNSKQNPGSKKRKVARGQVHMQAVQLALLCPRCLHASV